MADRSSADTTRLATGIAGLDFILDGGLPARSTYLIEGGVGTGKTTMALQFLLAGVANEERCAFVTLSESEDELKEGARSHGWSLEGIDLLDLSETQALEGDGGDYSVFTPDEVELKGTIERITESVERLRPERLVIDPISGIKTLAGSGTRYRQQMLQLKSFLRSRGVTTLLLGLARQDEMDEHVATAVRGLLAIRQESGDFGTTRRHLGLVKLRGSAFQEGDHPFRITTGGLTVFPRMGARLPRTHASGELLGSGIAAFDRMLGGGLERGTATVVAGQSGVGKTTMAMQFLARGSARGERVHVFSLDESGGSIRHRLEALGTPPPEMDPDRLVLERIRSTETYPAEFATMVRRAVDEDGATMVLIDSLTGYKAGITGERHMVHHLSQLLDYLSAREVTTLLTLEHTGPNALAVQDPFGVSYLSDNAVLLRFFEADGRVRRAVNVIKKRLSAHETSIREVEFTPEGIKVGSPLTGFRGVLDGTPAYVGQGGPIPPEASEEQPPR